MTHKLVLSQSLEWVSILTYSEPKLGPVDNGMGGLSKVWTETESGTSLTMMSSGMEAHSALPAPSAAVTWVTGLSATSSPLTEAASSAERPASRSSEDRDRSGDG